MKHIGIISVICLFITSCIEVELCDVNTHPHQYEMKVSYTWPTDLAEEEQPDSMYIIANRLFSTIRYQFSYNLITEEGRLINFWTHEKSNNASTYGARSGEDTSSGEGSTEGSTGEGGSEGEGENTEDSTDEEVGEEEEEEEPEEEEPVVFSEFSVRAGQYQFITLNHTELVKVDSLDKYMESNKVNSSNLGVSYHQYDLPYYKGELHKHWVDFNKGYRYVENPGPLFYQLKTVVTEKNQLINIQFEPERLSQEITFKLDIQLSGEYVTVDSVQAEISGVSPSVKLLSKHIQMDATKSCRMLFEATPGTMTGDSIVPCVGKVNVLGLMNSEDETMKTGPGLLYLAVFVHTVDADGNMVQKTCYAGINLRNHMLAQPLTKLTEDGYHHTISQPQVTIEIESRLPITREEILGVTHPGGNTEYWFKEEGNKGDYDLEV